MDKKRFIAATILLLISLNFCCVSNNYSINTNQIPDSSLSIPFGDPNVLPNIIEQTKSREDSYVYTTVSSVLQTESGGISGSVTITPFLFEDADGYSEIGFVNAYSGEIISRTIYAYCAMVEPTTVGLAYSGSSWYRVPFTCKFANFRADLMSSPDVYTNVYLRNNTNDPRYFVPSTSEAIEFGCECSTYNDAYAIGGTANTATQLLRLSYSLFIDLQIDSNYYNLDNIRTELWQPVITNYDSTDSNGYSMQWVEKTSTDIILNNPYYKLRIYDENTGDLIFEDTENTLYTINRTISINSFKLSNNSPEVINASIYAGDRESNTLEYSTLINPYCSTITNISDVLYSSSCIYVQDVYSNDLFNETISNQNVWSYTPPNVQQCFISIADQQNNYLDFSNYKVYADDILIYSPLIYREINCNVAVEIKDRYGISLKNETFTISRDENWLGVQINLYSLKVCNYLEQFHHLNLTRDPNYYNSDQFWSEYVGPHELIEYRIPIGYYKLRITWNNGSYVDYAYTLNGDDVLLLSSSNTLANIIYNINTVNTSISNQITNVEINLSAQNSEINSTVLNLSINLEGFNSTFSEILISQNTTITAISSQIDTLYVYQQNKFVFLENVINSSYAEINSSIFLINNSIFTAINSLSAELVNIDNNISGNMSLILQQNDYLTQIYQYSMFSDFLDWDNATAFTVDYLNENVEAINFINEYRNKSLEIQLRYESEIETIYLNALDAVNRYLPAENVEYRVYSVADGEYLDEWQDLNGTNIDIGFYDENVSEYPEIIEMKFADYLWFAIIALIFIFIVVTLYFRAKKETNRADRLNKDSQRKKKKKYSKIRDQSELF